MLGVWGAQALVGAAAGEIGRMGGAAAFAAFRVPGSRWFTGSTYLFSYDLTCNVLLNAAFPAREGTNVSGHGDVKVRRRRRARSRGATTRDRDVGWVQGKLFHDAFVTVARSPAGAGWVDYYFPRPGQTEASKKWTFVKAVRVDGVDALLASGFYE